MSLPSRYANEGLSKQDQSRVITSGIKRNKPIEYKLKSINEKVQDQVDYDIAMSPIDDLETDIIASFVDYTRNKQNIIHSNYDEMIIEQQSEIILDGNVSLLIIDTNFILSQLNILDDINKLANQYNLKVVIPLYVIKELDGLKSSKFKTDRDAELSSNSVSHLARWANDWIYSNLASSSETIKIQKMSQRLQSDLVKDQAILDCCLYFKQKFPQYLTILLSNDKNLCSLALSNDILTVSFNNEMTGEGISKTIHEENLRRFGKLEPKVIQSIKEERVKSKNTINPSDEWIKETQKFNINSEDDAINTIYTEIQTVLLAALHHCMEKEYGEDLDLIREYDKEQIITILDCSNLIIRFWFTVFKEYFQGHNKILPFGEEGKRKVPIHVDRPRNYFELKEFVKFWSTILQNIYDEIMNETEQEALKYLQQRWEKMASLLM
ncbi:unnamed protein product [Candida verbasci]|uniref:Transcriptional protein SWT1 n=1 Tax=Candida verbasci TaxID=1227364 RepID=A0A9W4XN84_9ASCO|nr:unnamed protein product [Candida verbasci]